MADILDRLKAALADRYQIGRELGDGAMSTIRPVQDPRHNRNGILPLLDLGKQKVSSSS
jgi:hypothetical protein